MNQPHVIGVISDTHGLLRPEAVQALQDSELIVHAGDVGRIWLANHIPPGQIAPHHAEPEVLRQSPTLSGCALDNLW